ncbi:MAG: hypothetical protein IPJ41_09820 [Phycisphaerales bacterium]|nr:hypothetical protein [Phycisphaerales bacterium]
MGTSWLWIGLAIVLFTGAGAALARFVVGDRPKGRLRCPRCWYELGAGLDACPECGRVVRAERDLRRTRRARLPLSIALLLALLGFGTLKTPQAMQHGAVGLVPDWMLIAGMPYGPPGNLGKELDRRHWEGEFSSASQRLLIRKSTGLLRESDNPSALARACNTIGTAEFLGQDEAQRHTKPWRAWVPATDVVDVDSLVLSLLPLLSSADANIAANAEQAINALEPNNLLAFPTVFTLAQQDPAKHATAADVASTMLDRPRRPYMKMREVVGWRGRSDSVPEDVRALLASLAEVPRDPEAMRALVRRALEQGSDGARLTSLWLIRGVCWPDDELRRLALAQYDPDNKITACSIVDFAVSGPLDDEATSVIRRALQTTDYEQWAWAVECLGKRGPEAAPLAPDIRQALGTFRVQMSAVPYAQITRDLETPGRLLAGMASGQQAPGLASLIEKLGRIGWIDDDVLAVWRAGLESDDANTRLTAAAALLRNGPPAGFDRAELTRIACESSIGAFGGLNGKLFNDAIQYGEADIPTVLQLLDEHRDMDRSLQVWLLGMAGTKAEGALPWLRNALHDQDAKVAANAAGAIRRIEWCLKHGDPPPEPRDQ